MKKSTLCILSLTLMFIVAGCSSSIDVSEGQAATISPQALAFLNKTKYLTVPSWLPISDKQVIEGREKFQSGELIEEGKMIKQFNLQVDSTRMANVPVLIITPPAINPLYKDVIAYNIHGGGFTVGTARDRSALLVAAKLGIRVYSIEYSLAPEAKYPVAINESFAVYKELLKNFDAKHIVGMSSSAGGEIMLLMIQKINEAQLPMMKAQILFCPAADISGDGDSPTANDKRDVVRMSMSKMAASKFYLNGADPKDPKVSPLFAPIPKDFPASVLISGTRDLIESNAIRLFWKLQQADITSELLIQEGMWHGFHWEWEMPESIATMKSVSKFVEKQFTEQEATVKTF